MWLNDILTTNEKGNPSDLSDLQKTKVGQKTTMQHIENTELSDLSDLSDQKKDICEVEPVKEADFCPLRFLNERDIGIDEVCTERGLHLVAGYTLSTDLKHLIAWWALGSFDRLLAAIHEKRPIARRVIVSSLNRYQLPRA